MGPRRRGGMGGREARTQEASVSIVDTEATEDAASRRIGRPGGSGLHRVAASKESPQLVVGNRVRVLVTREGA
jgi:hypothetical protein